MLKAQKGQINLPLEAKCLIDLENQMMLQTKSFDLKIHHFWLPTVTHKIFPLSPTRMKLVQPRFSRDKKPVKH